MACPNPLKPEDCDRINLLLRSIADTAEYLRKLEDCGIPCEEWLQQNEGQRQALEAIKRNFFPLSS